MSEKTPSFSRASGTPQEAEAIYHEIDRTRAAMDDTLDELRRRLSPSHIAHRAFVNMKEASSTMYHAALDTIKTHPIPAAIAGAGIVCFVGCIIADQRSHKNGHSSDTNENRSNESRDDNPGTSAMQSARRAVATTAHAAKDTVTHVAETVGDRTRQLAHQANVARHRAQESISRGYVASRDALERTFEHHPLLVGAGVFAAGMAIGVILPSTRKEDRWMGGYRDSLVDAAADRATRAARSAARATSDAAQRESLNDPLALMANVRDATGNNQSPRAVGAELGKRAGSVVGEAVQAAKDEVLSRGDNSASKTSASTPGSSPKR